MGIGSFVKKTFKKVDTAGKGFFENPTSDESMKNALSLVVGAPVPVGVTGEIARDAGLPISGEADRTVDNFDKYASLFGAGPKKIISGDNIGNDPVFESQFYQDNEELVIIAGTVLVVAVICIYATAFCVPAMTYGFGIASAKFASRFGSGNGLAADEAGPDTPIVGDSGGDGTGFGESWDLNTPAGRKSWMIAGAAVLGAVVLFYTVRHLRK